MSSFFCAANDVAAYEATELKDIFLTLDEDLANDDFGVFTLTGRGIGGSAVVHAGFHWIEDN